MAITFRCECGKQLQVKDEFAGCQGMCPACGTTLPIPEQSEEFSETSLPSSAEQAETEGDDFAYDDSGTDDRQEPEPGAEQDLSVPRPRPTYRDTSDEWRPPEDLAHHGGAPLDARDDFFAAPTPEIGELISASTSLTRGVEPMSPGTRLIAAMVVSAIGGAIGVFIASFLTSPFWQLFWPILLGGLALVVTLYATHFSHTCTYVGKEGVARYTCSGRRDRVQEDIFLFAEATELRTTETLHYTNGVYQNTTYSFDWAANEGKEVFQIPGTHKSEAGAPPPKDNYHFARMAELAWTNYLLPRVAEELNQSGTLLFRLANKGWVRVGEGVLAIHLNGQTTECLVEDIAQVRVDQGTFQIRRVDAQEGWFSSRGIYKFPYANLANSQLFLIVLKDVLGIDVT